MKGTVRSLLFLLSLSITRVTCTASKDIMFMPLADQPGESSLGARKQQSALQVSSQELLRSPRDIRGGASRTGVMKSENLEAGLRPRESYHLARKTFHFSTIMGFAALYSSKLPKRQFAQGMAALDMCVIGGELARLRIDAINLGLLRVFGAFMRVHELKKFSGIMYCLAGLGVTSVLFPKHIALLGMLQLALGDPVAALCGHATRSIGWSRVRSGKGLFGALGCATVLTMANTVVLAKSTFDGETPPLRRIVLAAGMIAVWTGLVELGVPSPQKTLPCDGFPLAFDDNAVLPVLGALGAATVFRVLSLGNCVLRPLLFA